MATHFSLYPSSFTRSLSENKLYMYLEKAYTFQYETSWQKSFLLSKFSRADIEELILTGILMPENHEYLSLAFTVYGSVCYSIISESRTKIYTFKELLNRALPALGHNIKSSDLKNLISFLVNFKTIQYMHLPCSSFTCITSDSQMKRRMESYIDCLYDTGTRMGAGECYEMSTDEGLDELRRLIG